MRRAQAFRPVRCSSKQGPSTTPSSVTNAVTTSFIAPRLEGAAGTDSGGGDARAGGKTAERPSDSGRRGQNLAEPGRERVRFALWPYSPPRKPPWPLGKLTG